MKSHFIFIYLSILSLFFGSCVPGKEISFDVLQAAEYETPINIDSVLVLNLAYYPWVDTLSYNVLNRIDKKEQIIIDTMIVASIFDGFFSVIDNSMFHELTRNQYFEIRGDTGNNFLEPLDIESVNLLCDEFKVSMIIALEYYGMDFEYNRFVNSYGENIAQLSIDRSTAWRIYQTEMGMIKQYVQRDTLLWTYSGTNYDNAEHQLPTIIDAAATAFWLVGESFAGSISPSWKEIDRNYHSFNLKKGKDISLNEEMLISYAKSNNKIKSFKAWINLAVIFEKKGDPIKAMVALSNAYLLRPKSEYVKFYKLELEKSILNLKKLEEQLENRVEE